MNAENLKVLTNIIGAVETGGQIYGHRRYEDYTPPYKNSSIEYTCTLGWAAFYGNEAEDLINRIRKNYPDQYQKAADGVAFPTNWVAKKWNPNAAQKAALIRIITTDGGKATQDEKFMELMKKYIADCEATYTKDVPAVMMYCEIRHLGGGAVNRIFKRCNGNYSLASIMASLKADQNDKSSSNQVGDKKFWSRHEKCVEFINDHAVKETDGERESKDAVKSYTLPEARKMAKRLLCQEYLSEMSGYTPEGKQCFRDAGRWTQTDPRKGDVIYFYSTSKGRVGHTGIVERVDPENMMVYTIEGNTESSNYSENGGVVARHSYSYAHVGGRNRVNGFGHPRFTDEVTADDFIACAASWIGYMEKSSKRSNLDSKTADRGYNNYTRFQRDACGYIAEAQWCQYFVSCVGVYCYTKTYGGTPVPAKTPSKVPAKKPEAKETVLNESQKWVGECTADELNVRSWAGKENPNIKSWPILKMGNRVGVCDTLKAKDGSDWYYIVISNSALKKPVHGFVSAKYIKRV